MRVIDSDEGPIYVVSTLDDANALWTWGAPYRARGDWLGWDGETNARDPWDHDFALRTAQMSDGKIGWVVQAELPGMIDVVREVTQAHPRWVAHFAENDMRFAERGAPGSVRLGQDAPHFGDTQPVLAWFDPRTVTSQKDGIDPRIWMPKALKPVANRILGVQSLTTADRALAEKFKSLAPPKHRTAKASKTWGFANIDIHDEDYLRYAGLDSMIELRLFHKMVAELVKRGQWEACQWDMRLQWHIDLMTFRGMPVDPQWARRLNTHFRAVIERNAALLAVHGVAPSGMGPSVGQAFGQLGVRSTRETKSGGDSWDRVMIDSIIELEHLAITEGHREAVRLAKWITQNRQAGKFDTTYVQPMLDVESRDGRIHCSMRAIGADTSRNSAERPPVQQMPKRSSRLIRAAFVAVPGWVICSADLKQGEPRVMAALSGDEQLAADIEGGDINSALAAATYGAKFVHAEGKDPKFPSYDLRQRGKAGFLANCYGGGLKKLASSALLKVAIAEAQKIRDNWARRYPKLTAFANRMNSQRAVVLESGWIAPLWDRYYVDASGIHCGVKPSRLGLNKAVQGNQAVLLRIAVHRLIDWGWSWALLMLVHDEIVMHVPESMQEQAVAALEAAMTMDFKGFPIRCDATVEGRSWMPQTDFEADEAAKLLDQVA